MERFKFNPQVDGGDVPQEAFPMNLARPSNGCELYDNVYIHVCIYSVYIYTFINRKDIVPQSAAVFFHSPTEK